MNSQDNPTIPTDAESLGELKKRLNDLVNEYQIVVFEQDKRMERIEQLRNQITLRIYKERVSN